MEEKARKLRIANFVTDEKFVDSAMQQLALTADRATHDFFLCPYWKIDFHYIWKVDFRYIKTKDAVKLVARKDILGLLKDGHYDAVILHSLDSMPYDIIASIPRDIKVLWFAWGYDLYGEKKVIQMDQFKPLTLKALKNYPVKTRLKNAFKGILDLEQDAKYASAVERVDFFSGCIPFEYVLSRKCSFFHARQVDFRYQAAKEFERNEDFSKGNSILIGNSANPTGNHLDILPYFDGVDVGDRKIVVPLSYAGPKYYIKKVKEAYSRRFGANCVFLDGFMPAAEYNRFRDSCNIAIFFHERQQSLGNINFILKRGGKVFLSETSVAYNYYKTQDCSIFSLQKDFCQTSLDTPLNRQEQIRNLDFIASSRTVKAKIERQIAIYDAIESFGFSG